MSDETVRNAMGATSRPLPRRTLFWDWHVIECRRCGAPSPTGTRCILAVDHDLLRHHDDEGQTWRGSEDAPPWEPLIWPVPCWVTTAAEAERWRPAPAIREPWAVGDWAAVDGWPGPCAQARQLGAPEEAPRGPGQVMSVDPSWRWTPEPQYPDGCLLIRHGNIERIWPMSLCTRVPAPAGQGADRGPPCVRCGTPTPSPAMFLCREHYNEASGRSAMEHPAPPPSPPGGILDRSGYPQVDRPPSPPVQGVGLLERLRARRALADYDSLVEAQRLRVALATMMAPIPVTPEMRAAWAPGEAIGKWVQALARWALPGPPDHAHEAARALWAWTGGKITGWWRERERRRAALHASNVNRALVTGSLGVATGGLPIDTETP